MSRDVVPCVITIIKINLQTIHSHKVGFDAICKNCDELNTIKIVGA
jgi:hypothetical protein